MDIEKYRGDEVTVRMTSVDVGIMILALTDPENLPEADRERFTALFNKSFNGIQNNLVQEERKRIRSAEAQKAYENRQATREYMRKKAIRLHGPIIEGFYNARFR
jgi:hypothetical protein